jgi:hypothetical protein
MTHIMLAVVFPLVASGVQIAVLITTNSVQPFDDLHCDASRPEWLELLLPPEVDVLINRHRTRFFGYAGVPLLISIPCFMFSVVLITYAIKTHKAVARANGRPAGFIAALRELSGRTNRECGVEIGYKLETTSDLSGRGPEMSNAPVAAPKSPLQGFVLVQPPSPILTRSPSSPILVRDRILGVSLSGSSNPKRVKAFEVDRESMQDPLRSSCDTSRSVEEAKHDTLHTKEPRRKTSAVPDNIRASTFGLDSDLEIEEHQSTREPRSKRYILQTYLMH